MGAGASAGGISAGGDVGGGEIDVCAGQTPQTRRSFPTKSMSHMESHSANTGFLKSDNFEISFRIKGCHYALEYVVDCDISFEILG